MFFLEVKAMLEPEMKLDATFMSSPMPEIPPRNPVVWQCCEHGKTSTLDFPAVS